MIERSGLWTPLAVLLVWAAPALAQPTVIISNPEAWTQSKAVSVMAGDTLRITGTAVHPGGIESVLVAGRTATLQRGTFASAVDFSVAIAVPDTLTRVVVRLNPQTGSPIEQTFTVEFRQSVSMLAPREWIGGESLRATEGEVIRVSGVAIHPGGVRSVQIAGRNAALQQDSRFPYRATFTLVFQAPVDVAQAIVRVTPASGEAFETRYAWTIARAASPPQNPNPQTTGGGVAPAGGTGPATSNSAGWAAMKKRGIAYGAVAAVGVGLTMVLKTTESEFCEQVGAGQDCFLVVESKPSFRTVGLGLVAAAALAATIDVVRTSKSASAPTSGVGSSGIRFEAPTLTHEQGRFALSLVRLRF